MSKTLLSAIERNMDVYEKADDIEMYFSSRPLRGGPRLPPLAAREGFRPQRRAANPHGQLQRHNGDGKGGGKRVCWAEEENGNVCNALDDFFSFL